MSGTILSLATGGISALLGPVVSRLADLIPDPAAKAAALQEFQEKVMAADAAMTQQQATINQAEASNESVFVSGWRPFIGWVGGVGLAWQIFLGPAIGYVASLCGAHTAPPVFDTNATMAILVPMLGLGAYRTIEKTQGLAGNGATSVAVRAAKLASATSRAATS
jgi:hypothetical protein